MEELRSTEILDKEIIADAQKKADRITQKAEAEIKRISESVNARVQEQLEATKKMLDSRITAFEADLNASVPLEKERFFVSFVQDSIVTGINEYLASLNEDKKLELCVAQCKKLNLDNKVLNAFVYGFDVKKAKGKLESVLGKGLKQVTECEFNAVIYEESFLENNQGIILMSDNEDIKCRFTLSEIMKNAVDKYRIELAESLFGQGAIK